MTDNFAERFIQALQEAEKTNEVEPLLNLFSEDAELRRLSGDEKATGREGASKFWQEYLGAFQRIRTTFTNVHQDGRVIVLEWYSEAEPESELPFRYDGVTILEVEGEQIRHFRTYYDSAKFIQSTSQSS